MLMKRKTLKFWAVIMCCLSVFSVSAASMLTKSFYANSGNTWASGAIIDSIPGVTMAFGSGVLDGSKTFTVSAANVDTTYNSVAYSVNYCKGNGQNVSMANQIPTRGCFYKFTTAYNGTLDVVCWARSGKQLYITEQVNGEAPATIYGEYNGSKPSADQIMCFTIEAKEGHTYYVFQNSGQMGLFGFTFSGDPYAPFVSPIENPSFEDVTAGTFNALSSTVSGNQNAPAKWTLDVNSTRLDAAKNTAAPSDGATLWNIWSGTLTYANLYQEITLPRGCYTLSADLRTEKAEQITDQRVYAALCYLNVYSDTLTHKGGTWNSAEAWDKLATTFYLPKEMTIRVGASSNGGADAKGWFQIDNFTLVRGEKYDSTLAVGQLNGMIAKAEEIKDLPMDGSAKSSLNTLLNTAKTMDRSEANVRSAFAGLDSVLAIAIPSAEEFVPLKAAIDTANVIYNVAAPRTFKTAIDHAQYVYDNGIQSEIASCIEAMGVNSLLFRLHEISNAATDTVDVTGWVINPTFDTNTNGWTSTTGAQNNGIANNKDDDFTIPFWENWNGAAYAGKMYQTVTNVPNGKYILKLAAFTSDGGDACVYLNEAKAAKATATPTFYEVAVNVTNNTLEFGLDITSGTWCGIDNASLRLISDSIPAYQSFDLKDGVATVENVGQLVDALRWNYEEKDITIELKNCTDDGGVYMLGKDRFEFPQTFGNITIKPADGASPVLAGSLTSNNGVKASTLTYEGLTWDYTCVLDPVQGRDKAQTADYNYNAKEYSPFHIQAVDSITEKLYIKNCKVYNLALPHLFISASNMANNTMIQQILVENCYIKDAGVQQDTATSQNGHLVQIKNANTFECDQFIFRENIVENWSNSQVFNVSRKGTTDTISPKFYVEISNNMFYQFGGQANNLRNFLEYNQTDGLNDREINVCNNIFYDRASRIGYPHSKLTILTPTSTQKVTLNVLNNLFYPEDVVAAANALEVVMNLPVQSGVDTMSAVTYNRNDLFMGEDTIVYTTGAIFSYKKCPWFTAGVDETYLGPLSMYYIPAFTESETGAVVENLQELKEALAYDEYDNGKDITIELKNCTDDGGIYKLGNAAKPYADFDNLTIKAADGESPVLYGTISNSNLLTMDNFTIEGLTFMGDTANVGSSADSYSPINSNTKDTIGTFLFKNCAFNYLGKEQILRLRGAAVYGSIVYDGCIFDNYGWGQLDGGNHAFQPNSSSMTIGNFIIKESVFSNYQGKQFINFSNVRPLAGSDSTMNVTIENNTFYKFSGNGQYNNAIQYRNFLELTGNKNHKVINVNINNNLFYDNYCDTLGIANRLALFTPDATHALNVSLQNNVFAPDSVMYQVVDAVMDSLNLPIYGVKIPVTRNDLFLKDLDLSMDNLWVSEEDMTIYKTSKLFTAGTEGTYVGPFSMYIKDIKGLPVVGYFTKQKDMDATAALVANDPIYRALNADDKLNVVVNALTDVTATATIDLTPYDVIIIQETFGGGDKILSPDGALAISKLNVPTIYNKTYAMKSGRALTGTSAAGADANNTLLTVAKENQSWALFDGIEFSDTNTVVMFNSGAADNGSAGTKGINYVKALEGMEGTLLATPTGVTDATACINFVPAGKTVGTETTAADMFIFGLNSGALLAGDGENLTDANLQLWKNAVYILAGIIDETPRNLVGLKKIGYFSKLKDMDATAATVEADPIYTFLRNDDSLNVVMNALTDVSLTATADLSEYDAIIIQESFGGGDKILAPDGVLGLSKISVPFLYNKNYALKSGRALASGSGTGVEATGVFTITLDSLHGSRALFQDMFEMDTVNRTLPEIALFTASANDLGAEGTKALNYTTGVSTCGTLLASPTGINASTAINYVKAGEAIEDQVLKADAITMNQNFGAICANNGANMTAANYTLWKNAIYILSGIRKMDVFEIPAPTAIPSTMVLNNVYTRDGSIYVNANTASTINVYNVLGGLVRTINANEGLNTINGLSKGQMYIIRAGAENVKVVL